MFAILLTHADAQNVTSPTFRSLTELGREQINETAKYSLDNADHSIPELTSGILTIEEILTSPSDRCVESVLLFADSIRNCTSTSEIKVRNRLREQRDGQLSAGEVVSVLDDTTSPVVLVCTHGDLAGALPVNVIIKIKPEFDNKGWFKIRPTLSVLQYERGSRTVARLRKRT